MTSAAGRLSVELVRRASELTDQVCRQVAGINATPVDEELHRSIQTQIEELFAEPAPRSRVPQAPTTDRGRTELTHTCRQALRQGLPIDDLMRGFRAALEVGMEFCDAVAEEFGTDAATRQTVSRRLLAWSDLAMSVASGVYRHELIPTTDRLHRFGPALSAIRAGAALTGQQVEDLAAAGIALDRPWHPVVARPTQPADVQRAAAELLPRDDPRDGVLAVANGQLLGLLASPPRTLTTGRAGVGHATGATGLGLSFQLADRALETIMLLERPGIWRFDELGVLAAIAADRPVGASLTRLYLAPLDVTAGGREVGAALAAFIDADGAVREAARRLGVHENTVRYRLSRYEELTGANLRSTRTRFEIWWALTAREHALTLGG